MQDKIQNLLNYCFKDTDSIEFQLFLISVKCLLPFENKIGCLFDRDRYKKELELFSCYMERDDETISYWLQNKKPSSKSDELSEFKIIPVVIANTIWENTIEEVLKAVTFYTLNNNAILNAFLVTSALFEHLNDSDPERMEEATRERLINFSIKEFFAQIGMEISRNYMIAFERERIKLLSKPVLFDDYMVNNYRVLNYIFEKDDTRDSNLNHDEDKEDLIKNFSIYLYKLRKGLISPEKLIIPDKIPDIRECLKNPAFTHPLLGRCQVLKITGNTALVRNKSGLLRIRI
ncbi:MAG TPA: hypothetical protein PLM18_07610 [Sedimentibacter sp.]|nr:hypothetical protein [Sedimentibacter sp.]